MEAISKFFKLKEHGTNVKTEVIAGIATFLTMAYIIVVNPGILSATGMPFEGVLVATVLVSAISSIMMGAFANLPFGLAPGMGINAFFAFTLVLGSGGKISWETALGAVFISGLVFMLLSAFKVREMIVKAIPMAVRFGVAAGIGLFLAFIGLKGVGFVVSNPATIVAFGGLNPQTIVFIVGLLLTAILVSKRVKGDLVIGILVTSVLAIIVSAFLPDDQKFAMLPALDKIFTNPFPALGKVFLKLDIVGALSISMVLPIFSLVFVDMFDSISTFVGVAEVGGFMDEKTGAPKNVGKALFVDAIATTISGLFGTSSATTYIESAAGVEEGGKTGLTAVVTGLLFLPFIFLSGLLQFIPTVATAPILVLIGLFMMHPLAKLDWGKFDDAIPAFLSLILIPLTYSISMGLVWGFISYTLIRVLTGRFKEISPALWVINLFCVIHLVEPLLQKFF